MQVGPYEILGEVGRGGMGVVFRVRRSGGEDGALKLVFKADAAAFARFERERRLLASLGEEHGFVGLLDAGTSPAGPWLLMPFVPGGTLRARLARGPLGVAETVSIGVVLASALGAAHERGIVHRDVKPENVLFTAAGRALLADLGLAKHFDRSASGGSQSLSLSSHGSLRGTAGYMAPEQLEDSTRVGPAADVFALGAVLYECLAGRPAFEGANPIELCRKMGSGVLEPLAREDAPGWLVETIMKALAFEPAARFADGRSFALALRGAAPARRRLLVPLSLGVALGGLVLAGFLVRRSPQPEARDAKTPAPESADALDRLALSKIEQGDPKAAIDLESRAIALAPGLATAWSNRGLARGETGDRPGGIADATRAIELDPRLEAPWFNRGCMRAENRDIDGALADLTRAIELAPGHAEAWMNRGSVRSNKGDHEGEIADETRAIELSPLLAAAWSRRGDARGNMEDWEGSIADETRALELDPKNALAWYSRATGRGKRGDWDGMIEDLTRSLELDPRSAVAWNSVGFARASKDDWTGALAAQDKALELDPGNVTSWYRRGKAKGQLGDMPGAVADWEHWLELDPNAPNAPEVRKFIAQWRAQQQGR